MRPGARGAGRLSPADFPEVIPAAPRERSQDSLVDPKGGIALDAFEGMAG